jgi:hypothetical protein
MMNKSILASLIVLLAWTGIAGAQGGLGVPVATDNAAECQDCRPRPYRPILNTLTRGWPPVHPVATTFAPLPPLREMPTRDEVARMVDDGGFSPAEIAAAKIRIDETQARARQAAVKYLATVDCHYYPEAELSLIAALRADRSETVRLEAAQALGGCRGVTVRILDALHLTATMQELDGNPAESSERVRNAARASLNRLLSSGMPAPPVDIAPARTSVVWPVPTPPPPLAPVPAVAPAPAAARKSVVPASYETPIQAPAVSPQELQIAATVGTIAAVPVVPQQERDITASVGVPSKSAAAPTPTPARPAAPGFFLQNLISGRASGPTQTGVDPRLRGVTPLGSDSQLAIPGATSHPVAATLPPYNN